MYRKKRLKLMFAFITVIMFSHGMAYTGFDTFDGPVASASAEVSADKMEKAGNIATTTVKASHEVQSVTKQFLNHWSSITPAIQTIVHQDGTVSAMSSAPDASTIEIHEFDAFGSFLKRLSIPKELPEVGAFARDDDKNYYIFYAKPVKERAFAEKNMVLVKYSPEARKISSFALEAQTSDERWAAGYSGVKTPFANGNSKMEISGDMIAVYFAREMFVSVDGLNHQASYGFILDKNTFERLSGIRNQLMPMPSAGHSFNQYILPIKDGFLFVDHGDVGPRGFGFNRVTPSGSASIVSFPFKQGGTYQHTYAEMGGVVESEEGYLFVGTYEKSANASESHNDSRNIFILTMNKQLDQISEPVWVTNYTNKETDNAIFPKIVRINDREYALLWQHFSVSGKGESSAYFTIIDSAGRIIKPITELLHVPLNGFDTLRYNDQSGLIHWAVNEGANNVVLYSFDPYAQAAPLESVRVASEWARSAITSAVHAQLVTPDLLGGYKQRITREEFCRLTVRYMEARTGKSIDFLLEEKGKRIDPSVFADTDNKEVLAAYVLGIVNGTGNQTFTPDGFITREQAAVMIRNMQRVLDFDTVVSANLVFADQHRMSSWAADAIHYTAVQGIMNGVGDDLFDPQGIYTREQAIVTFNNIRTRFPL